MNHHLLNQRPVLSYTNNNADLNTFSSVHRKKNISGTMTNSKFSFFQGDNNIQILQYSIDKTKSEPICVISGIYNQDYREQLTAMFEHVIKSIPKEIKTISINIDHQDNKTEMINDVIAQLKQNPKIDKNIIGYKQKQDYNSSTSIPKVIHLNKQKVSDLCLAA